MNRRTHMKVGGLMPILVVSALTPQMFASPAIASSRTIHASGSFSFTIDFDSIELVQQGQQCLFYASEVTTYTGTLAGTSVTEGRVEVKLFATCEEAVNAGPGGGIRSNFRAVESFESDDGRKATFRDVGGTDTEGHYEGIVAIHGDLNGVVNVVGGAGPTGTYDGFVVVND